MRWWLGRKTTIGVGTLIVFLCGMGILFYHQFFQLQAILVESHQNQEIPSHTLSLLEDRARSSTVYLLVTTLTAILLIGSAILKLNHDAQKHQQAQQELQSTADIYRRAIVEAPIPVMVHAEDGEVLEVSRPWMELTGYTEADISTTSDWIEQAYGISRKEAIQANIATLYQLNQRIDEGAFAILTRNGRTRIWSFFSSPLGTLPDDRQIVNSSAVDITNFQPVEAALNCLQEEIQQQVEEKTRQLEQANVSLESFCFTVAHDLYAPLRTIQRCTQILLEEHNSCLNATERDYLQRVYRAALRTEAFIRDLLEYYRLDRPNLLIQPVNLNSIVSQVLTNLEETLQQRQATVNVRGPLGVVQANPPALTQAIANLLTNAAKFTESGTLPQIDLWSEEIPEQKIRLYIQDNGIGITPENQSRIFRVFERVYPTELYAGNGIGLALVQRAVERMNGRVGVDSQPGQGSRFWLELPKMTE